MYGFFLKVLLCLHGYQPFWRVAPVANSWAAAGGVGTGSRALEEVHYPLPWCHLWSFLLRRFHLLAGRALVSHHIVD